MLAHLETLSKSAQTIGRIVWPLRHNLEGLDTKESLRVYSLFKPVNREQGYFITGRWCSYTE